MIYINTKQFINELKNCCKLKNTHTFDNHCYNLIKIEFKKSNQDYLNFISTNGIYDFFVNIR